MSTEIPITAQRYNDVRNLVRKILGTSALSAPDYGYGQTVRTSEVTGNFETNANQTDKVTADQYEQLYIDLIRVRAHQVGPSAISINPFVVGDYDTNLSSTDKIELAYIQALEVLSANIETDRFLIDINTQATELELFDEEGNSTVSSRINSERGNWNGSISHIFKITFGSGEKRRAFFNAGGEIRFDPFVDYAGSQAKTVDWQREIDKIGIVRFGAQSTSSSTGQGTGSSVGSLNLTSTYQLCYSKSGANNYFRNNFTVSSLELSDAEIQFKVEFLDGLPSNTTFGIDEPVLGDFVSAVKLLQPDGSVSVNGAVYDTVIIPIEDLPVSQNISNL